MFDQLGNGPDAGAQVGERQHLCLVKYNDALGDIVEFPALRGTAGEERFKKLHRCGHDHRHVPGLGGTSQAGGFRRGFLIRVIEYAGVVLQNTVRPQDLAEFLSGLLDDGGVRDHIDYTGKSLGFGLGQSKGQRGHGLSSASWNGQRVEARGTALSLLDALL